MVLNNPVDLTYHTQKNIDLSYLALAKDCGSLAVPLNGSVIGLDTTFPNEIAFRCDDGFNMAGSRIRKCLSTGIWSGNQTSCTGNSYPFH